MSPLDSLPWESSLATQHDVPVQCLPFQISPFPILEKLRKVSPREGTIKDGLRFDPSTIRFNFVRPHSVSARRPRPHDRPGLPNTLTSSQRTRSSYRSISRSTSLRTASPSP